jgi:hypothetical protein
MSELEFAQRPGRGCRIVQLMHLLIVPFAFIAFGHGDSPSVAFTRSGLSDLRPVCERQGRRVPCGRRGCVLHQAVPLRRKSDEEGAVPHPCFVNHAGPPRLVRANLGVVPFEKSHRPPSSSIKGRAANKTTLVQLWETDGADTAQF